ncbi:hypothetical protein PYW08_010901 [Mythimna loreyi]|uniref:Uncharacterized protein n=1 Tax=Mythimna loreyi TaxID=667449 RepID=A0ACC2Q2M0_9NEOP|nr:hypothetical protein PYW08_010901 [Mythimna loreyi]
MLFYSFFKSLVGKDVVVELKNDLSICGTLHSVDQYLNIKLSDISVIDPEKYPHMLSVKNCFIRGSVVRYVQLPADEVDTQLLQDAARKEATPAGDSNILRESDFLTEKNGATQTEPNEVQKLKRRNGKVKTHNDLNVRYTCDNKQPIKYRPILLIRNY